MALGVAGCVTLCADRAAASPPDVFGFGADGVAESSARAARADDGHASYYNPGGLALGRGHRLAAGPAFHLSLLKAQGGDRPFAEKGGAVVALDADLPLEGPLHERIRFGFGAFFLPTKVLRFRTRRQSDPFFPYYDNRLDRMVVLPSIGVRLTDWLGVGASANVLAGISGPTEVFDGPSGGLETRVDQRASTVASLIWGVQARPTDHLRLGFTHRRKFAAENSITGTSNVGGVPLEVKGEIRESFFSPEAFVLGVSWLPSEAIELEVDASYLRWGQWRGPGIFVRAELPGVDLRSRETVDLWRDVWTVRGAGNHRLRLEPGRSLTLRLGGGYESSIQSDVQQGATNMIDTDKVLLSGGGTFGLREDSDHAVRVGLGVQTHLLSAFEQDKVVCTTPGDCGADTVFGDDGDDPSANVDNPGFPTLAGSGSVWALVITVGVDL